MTNNSKIYWIELSFRSEVLEDFLRSLDNFRKDCPEHTYLKKMEWEQLFPFPDFNYKIELATWIDIEKDPVIEMSKILKYFINSIEKVNDSYYIFESINYTNMYTGKRETPLKLNSDETYFGIKDQLKSCQI